MENLNFRDVNRSGRKRETPLPSIHRARSMSSKMICVRPSNLPHCGH